MDFERFKKISPGVYKLGNFEFQMTQSDPKSF